jgi:hypothetical protein
MFRPVIVPKLRNSSRRKRIEFSETALQLQELLLEVSGKVLPRKEELNE